MGVRFQLKMKLTSKVGELQYFSFLRRVSIFALQGIQICKKTKTGMGPSLILLNKNSVELFCRD